MEEELEDFISDRDRRIMEDKAIEDDYKINIKIGDIIVIYEYAVLETGDREVNGYRLFIVQNIKKEQGKPNQYKGYKLSSQIKDILQNEFQENNTRKTFSNGRYVRNLYEKIKIEQADRICNDKNEDIDLIKKIDVQNVINKTCNNVEIERVIGF